jgi:hypothetical protein
MDQFPQTLNLTASACERRELCVFITGYTVENSDHITSSFSISRPILSLCFREISLAMMIFQVCVMDYLTKIL